MPQSHAGAIVWGGEEDAVSPVVHLRLEPAQAGPRAAEEVLQVCLPVHVWLLCVFAQSGAAIVGTHSANTRPHVPVKYTGLRMW